MFLGDPPLPNQSAVIPHRLSDEALCCAAARSALHTRAPPAPRARSHATVAPTAPAQTAVSARPARLELSATAILPLHACTKHESPELCVSVTLLGGCYSSDSRSAPFCSEVLFEPKIPLAMLKALDRPSFAAAPAACRWNTRVRGATCSHTDGNTSADHWGPHGTSILSSTLCPEAPVGAHIDSSTQLP